MLTRRGAAARGASHAPSVQNKDALSPQVMHAQILRNAYIVAQSQLLQLAKQMEYDVDISEWEDEMQEKMQEFWEQTRRNVDEFCARMRSKQGDKPRIAAEVVKSPRKKRDEVRFPVSPSPSPKKAVDALCSDDEKEEGYDYRDAKTHDTLQPPSSGAVDDTEPNAKVVSSSASPPLPALTPGTGLRQKRTLGSTLRSTKKPEPKEPVQVKAPSRFRSSFLNKSLRHAMEEKQTSMSPDSALDEPSPFHDAVSEPSKEEMESRPARPSLAHGGGLDALRTRLEHVRRASTTPGANALSAAATDQRSTLARAPLDTQAPEVPTDTGHRSEAPKSAPEERMPSSPHPIEATPAKPMEEPLKTTITPPRPVSRPVSPTRSPSRDGVGNVHVPPPFLQRSAASATSHIPTPTARSPGRLREELLSPFRPHTADTTPSASPTRVRPSPSRQGMSKIPSPVRKPIPALPSSSPASIKRPASVADMRPTQQNGFGSRIKGLLGLSTTRPASVLQQSTPRPVPSKEHDVSETMPGSFTTEAPRPAKAATPIKAKPWQSSSVSRPGMRPVSVAAMSRPGSSASVRPGTRVSSATRPTYTYDAQGKRRKLSQHPLSESTNHEERIQSEDALKNKLTTQPVRPMTKPVRASNTTVRPPGTRVWSSTASRPPPPRSSALSSHNVFQQVPTGQDDHDETADVDLPDVASEYSDSDDETAVRKRKLEPSWTRGRELEEILLQQSTIDPDEIFGCQHVGPVPLDTMLPARKGDRRRMRHRTSSANWNGPDGLAQWEIDRYNERMGIQSASSTGL